MNRVPKILLVLWLLLQSPATAAALDTLESHGAGLSTLEIAGSRYGSGLGAPDRSGYRFGMTPYWGLTDGTHAYLSLGLESSDRHQGGLELLTLGIFRTLVDNTLKLDIFGEITALGAGLTESRRLWGVELNLDGEDLGIYFRDNWQWVSDSGPQSGQTVIARLTRWTYGLKLDLTGNSQLLGELRRESSHGFLSRSNGKHDLGWALGHNLLTGRGIKIMTEACRVTAPGRADHWNYTVAIRRNW